jgi:two-component system sensor histidine kinase RpfC
MGSVEKKLSWYDRLNTRLKKTGDSEPEQAKLRLTVGFLILVYICLPWGEGEKFADVIVSSASLVTIWFYTSGLAIFIAICINPTSSPIRRFFGASLDMICLSFLMFHSSDGSVPLFFMYLWVILGNGFRYGVKYLYISQAIGLLGFIAVIVWGDYWQKHQNFGISFILLLCVIPLYASFLLKKLHSAVNMAKQANEAKSRFLANMSHELRTPLNGVIGLGELLGETRLNIEQKELVSSMNSASSTLLELIENILDISKIEAGKTSVESSDFDLHSLVNSVVYMLALTGDKKGISVSCSFNPDTPFSLTGDQQHIRQVLINLLGNAIKFTEKGSVTLSVNRVSGSDLKPRIRFEISDTGIGMSSEAMNKIFDNFTQADSSTNRAFGGTGLGTTISKELVELMGGEIGVESEEKKGSTFWFELPLLASKNSKNNIADNHVLLLAGEDTASVIRPFLKDWQVEFSWARSLTRALSQLIQASDSGEIFDIVIVDQECLIDVNAVQFAQMVNSESLFENTSLVLVNSSETMIDFNRTNHYYISTIENPDDKRLVFNALHAAQSVNVNDSEISTMAEHYAKQAGAKALNILVAEDNLVNQQVIKGILNNAGHKVRIANTGEQAIDILSKDLDSIDMTILDMNMPEISGIDVVKSLRFMDTSAKMPVIMLTADATPEAKTSSLEAGANLFLTKPINPKRLLESIASLSRNCSPKTDLNKNVKNQTYNRKTKSRFIASEWYEQTVLDELYTLDNDPNFIKQLATNFKNEGKQHIQNIRSSMHDDYLIYRENLHALKGSSLELGANKLVEICILGESFKPYDIGSEGLLQYYPQLEEIFKCTTDALSESFIQGQINYSDIPRE